MALQTILPPSGGYGNNVTTEYNAQYAKGGPGKSAADTLAALLGANASLTNTAVGRAIFVNESGEYFGPYTLQTIATQLQQGSIWIDYCGWPMYYALQNGTLVADGTRFNSFLSLTSRYKLAPLTFNTSQYIYGYQASVNPINFPYSRSLAITHDPTGLPWFIPNTDTPMVQNQPVYGGSVWIYSCFAITTGSGAYFYAAPQITPQAYANFIVYVMKGFLAPLGTSSGGTSGTGTGSTSGGGGSGSSGGGSGGSSGSGGSGGLQGGSLPGSGTNQSGPPTIPKYVLYGGGALGLAGLGYFLWREGML